MEGEGCMGYNLKTTYSDLAELEKGQVATISDIIGSNTPGTQRAKGGRIFDLKLGNAGDLGNGLVNGFKDHRVSPVESLPMTARLSKRGRVPSSGSQSVSCLVDGCKSDLSKCRDYHRRHKVCELHSKTPRVTIRGQEQRFCQQCSRFHSLPEFDEGKRSCRKRLEGHNRRRRKPQPANPATFLPRAPGDRFIQFTTSPITPSTSTASSTWSRVSKPGSNAAASYSATACGIYSNAYKGRHFPFLQGSDSSHSSSSGGSNYPGMWCSSGLNGQVMENNVALSLLSSSTAQTLEMGLERMSEPTAMAPFVQTRMQYGSGSESYSGSQGALGGHRGGSGLLFENGVFPGGMDGGAHQTLSFSWE